MTSLPAVPLSLSAPTVPTILLYPAGAFAGEAQIVSGSNRGAGGVHEINQMTSATVWLQATVQTPSVGMVNWADSSLLVRVCAVTAPVVPFLRVMAQGPRVPGISARTTSPALNVSVTKSTK